MRSSRKRVAIVALSAASGLVTYPAAALECACPAVDDNSFNAKMAQSDAVFEGIAESSVGADQYDVHVHRTWKGSLPKTVRILADNSRCLASINGRRYIIFARRSTTGPELVTDSCNVESAESQMGRRIKGLLDGPSATQDAVADFAAKLAVSGKLASARSLLASKAKSETMAGLYVLTAIELEEGHLAAASDAANRMLSVGSVPYEATLLATLVNERQRAPTTAWSDALIAALKLAGKQQVRFVGAVPAISEPVPSADFSPGTGERLLFAYAARGVVMSPPYVEAMTQATSAHATLPVQIVAIDVLSSDSIVGDDLRRQAHLFAKRAFGELARSHPADGFLAMGAVLGSWETPPDPLSADEVARLETAARLASFRLPLRELYLAFFDVYKRARYPIPGPLAFQAAVRALPTVVLDELGRRVTVTTKPELRDRAIAVLAEVGARLAKNETLVERIEGAGKQSWAARLREDTVKMEAASKEMFKYKRLRTSMEDVAMLNLPVAALWADWFDRSSMEDCALARLAFE